MISTKCLERCCVSRSAVAQTRLRDCSPQSISSLPESDELSGARFLSPSSRPRFRVGDNSRTSPSRSGRGSFLGVFEGRNPGVGINSRSSMSLSPEIEGCLFGLSNSGSSTVQISARSARTRSTVAGWDE